MAVRPPVTRRRFKRDIGMVPGPAWKSPDVLARPGAFPEPDTAVGGRTAYSTREGELWDAAERFTAAYAA
ncbi:hypothetical protein ACFWFI_04620 [Streptomyces sp. NPDC060209]|uniref:hypothetical protein n=1 Tax=Streptomyces sp. NPDC060209 TaxID=3347073 RepID=UPI00365426E4